MNSFFKITALLSLILIFFTLNELKAESLEDIAKEINDVRDQISKLQKSNKKEAITIDNALKKIDKVVEFAHQQVKSGDIKSAASTMNFVDQILKNGKK